MKEIYLGLDLCKKNIQMSYYREDKQEPESIYQLNNTETYQIPNVMFYSFNEKKWYVGNSVSTIRFQTEGIMVEDVLGRMDSDTVTMVGEESYSPDELLLILLKTHIQEFMGRSEEYELCGLTITLEFGLIIPAFSAVICSRLSPRICV